jgi:hypothetical protein
MKIYCLLIDAMPSTAELQEFAQNNNFQWSKQISNCFTTATLCNMFTGFNSTDIVPGGLAYHSMANPEMKKLKWIEDESFHLVDIAKQNNWKWTSIGRVPFFARDLLGVPQLDPTFKCDPTKQGHLDTLYDFSLYEETLNTNDRFSHLECAGIHPDGTKNFFWDGMGDDTLRSKYLENQKNWIEKTQSKKEDGIYFFQNVLWSHHKWGPNAKNEEDTKSDILNWLKMWDFEEEDACFWIFSDHGDDADDFMTPKSYLSWTMIRDNNENLQGRQVKPIISSMDFYQFAREKMEGKKLSNPLHSASIYEGVDPNRIYFLEDARMHTNINKMVAASAIMLQPHPDHTHLLQVCHHNTYQKTYVYSCDFSDVNQLSLGAAEYKTAQHIEEVKLLRDSLFNRFSWLV